MSYSKLRGLIREKFETQAAFSQAMGKHEATISKKLTGQAEWTRQEIEKASVLLEIPADKIHVYFFTF